jgi:hypothetical protein
MSVVAPPLFECWALAHLLDVTPFAWPPLMA